METTLEPREIFYVGPNATEAVKGRATWLNERMKDIGLCHDFAVSITLPQRSLTQAQVNGLYKIFTYPYEVGYNELIDMGEEFIWHAGKNCCRTYTGLRMTETRGKKQLDEYLFYLKGLERMLDQCAGMLDVDEVLPLWVGCQGYSQNGKWDPVSTFEDAVMEMVQGCTVIPPGLAGAMTALVFANGSDRKILLQHLALDKEDLVVLLSTDNAEIKRDLFAEMPGLLARGVRAKEEYERIHGTRAYTKPLVDVVRGAGRKGRKSAKKKVSPKPRQA